MKVSFTTWKFVLIPLLMAACILIHEWKLLAFYYAGAIIGYMFNKSEV